uniref:SGNH_hydro domain-containing protein n=1 Tax=Panagrellus redivivus TaxID=6233 RepID=A0A7E4VG13_PANRE
MTTALKKVDDKCWDDLHQYYVSTAKFKEAEVLLIGGDHIALLSQSRFYHEHLAPLHCFCFGSMGDTIANLLWRVEDGEIDNYTPKAVVVSIGQSDTDLSVDEMITGLSNLKNAIRQRQPNAKVFFLQLLPSGRAPNNRWEFVSTVNASMEAGLGKDAKVIEIDLEAIENQGAISAPYMFDFFHLSQEGYDVIFVPVLAAIQDVLCINGN